MKKVLTGAIHERLAEQFLRFYPKDEPEPLSGGLLNQVWRITGRPGSVPETVIVKWAPPYIASAPDVPLDPRRLAVEASALQAFTTGGLLAAVDTSDVRPLFFMDLSKRKVFSLWKMPAPSPIWPAGSPALR